MRAAKEGENHKRAFLQNFDLDFKKRRRPSPAFQESWREEGGKEMEERAGARREGGREGKKLGRGTVLQIKSRCLRIVAVERDVRNLLICFSPHHLPRRRKLRLRKVN